VTWHYEGIVIAKVVLQRAQTSGLESISAVNALEIVLVTELCDLKRKNHFMCKKMNPSHKFIRI